MITYKEKVPRLRDERVALFAVNEVRKYFRTSGNIVLYSMILSYFRMTFECTFVFPEVGRA